MALDSFYIMELAQKEIEIKQKINTTFNVI